MTSHPLELLFKKGMQSLTEGRLEQFLLEYKDNVKSSSEQRVLSHLRIKEMLQKSEYHSAIEAIRMCFNENGEHLGLWCDLATCYYLTQQYGLWAITLQKTEHIFCEIKSQISSSSRLKTRIMLAKFFEETGDLHKSLNHWLSCLNSADVESILRARINIVRLLSLYPMGPELVAYYKDLKPALHSQLTPDLEIEILHALALAEICLLGPAAWSQVSELIKDYEMEEEDQSLIFFDLCDQIMRSGEQLPRDLLLALEKLKPLGPYEQFLKSLALNPSTDMSWVDLATKMPVGNFLRLTSLVLKIGSIDKETASTLKRGVDLLLLGLTPKDRRVWSSLLPSASSNSPSAVLCKDMQLIINDRFPINLKSKKKIFELLSHLSERNSITFEELADKIYGAEYNESYFHRFRRLAKRFNDEVLSVGAPALLEINNGRLTLLGELKKQ